MAKDTRPVTRISHHTHDRIFVRGHDLVSELIGEVTFTEMIFLQLTGVRPAPKQTALLDAVLVTLMEHGITPSVLVARLVYDSAPEALQGAVAAGLNAVGSKFVGSMEQAAALLEEVIEAADAAESKAITIAERYRSARRRLPGFGHNLHGQGDPRTPRLLGLAEGQGVKGDHIRALRTLSGAIDRVYERHIVINATGAVAAVLGEIGIPQAIMRGIAVISRAAGLVGHIQEERLSPSAMHMWDVALKEIPYASDESEHGSTDTP